MGNGVIMFRLWSLLHLRKRRYMYRLSKGGYTAVYNLIPWYRFATYEVFDRNGLIKSGAITWKEAYDKIHLLKFFDWR